MAFRLATEQDISRILEIANLLYLDIPNFVWNTRDFVEKQIKRGEYFVAEDNGDIVGVVSLRVRGNKMYIETLAVDKEKQQGGVGKEIIEFAKQYTREHGLRHLVACAFYEYNNTEYYLKQGFTHLGSPGSYEGHSFYRFEIRV